MFAGGSHCNTKVAVHCQCHLLSIEGRLLTISFLDKDKSVEAPALGQCPSCAGGSIDLTTPAFTKLAPQGAGRIQVTWDFE